jgi:phosphotransacetylase
MAIQKLEDILVALKGKQKKRLVVAWAVDKHSIEAVQEAIEIGIVDVILVGDKKKIEQVCHEIKTDSCHFEIIDCQQEDMAATIAVNLIREGKGDILMKGLLSTDKYMRAILNKEGGLLPPKAVLSHIAVIENQFYHKLMIASDVAIIPQPDLNQKVAMANYLIQTARALGIEKPKLAVIAATEQVLPSMQACIDASLIAKMADRGQIKNAIIDGPLALDVALDYESAETKMVQSPVAGDADCLLFPNLEAANVFYKMSTKMCRTEQAVFVAGAIVPCILTSRGDSAKTKLYSIALAVLFDKK